MRELIIDGIGFTYRNIIKPLLFLIDPEFVHNHMISIGETMGNSSFVRGMTSYTFNHLYPQLPQSVNGIQFGTPLGLSAGFDYEAKLTGILPSIGFGFQTVGTVTNKPYEGNKKPRLGRLPESLSLMVNKGFKNPGAYAIAAKLSQKFFAIPVGISIGRTNSVYLQTQKESVTDILQAFTTFERSKVHHAYYELNISCPNLYGSIEFYSSPNLKELLSMLDTLSIVRPVFIKMPIEKNNSEVLRMLEIIAKHRIAGVIFGNLQKNRHDPSLVPSEVARFPIGNFSGRPTYQRSNELIRLAYKNYRDRFTIIGCGGIFSADDAYEKITSGATLLQLITGLIFKGPQLVTQINQGLVARLLKDGFTHISQAIGSKNNV